MKMMNMKLAKEQMPDIGDKIETPDGLGKVVGMNILERVLRIELQDPQRVSRIYIRRNYQTMQKIQYNGQVNEVNV